MINSPLLDSGRLFFRDEKIDCFGLSFSPSPYPLPVGERKKSEAISPKPTCPAFQFVLRPLCLRRTKARGEPVAPQFTATCSFFVFSFHGSSVALKASERLLKSLSLFFLSTTTAFLIVSIPTLCAHA